MHLETQISRPIANKFSKKVTHSLLVVRWPLTRSPWQHRHLLALHQNQVTFIHLVLIDITKSTRSLAVSLLISAFVVDVPQSGPSLGRLSLTSPTHAVDLFENRRGRTSDPRETTQSIQYQQSNQEALLNVKPRLKYHDRTGLVEVDEEIPEDPLSVLALAGTLVDRNCDTRRP